MTTSFYFNNFNSSMEKQLVEDLVAESIKIYGNDVYYCPATLTNYDDIYGDDRLQEYNNAYLVEMYIRSVDGYEGDQVFLSKFGLEIRDQVTFSVAIRTFNEEVGVHENITRPREGDLIYLTLNPNRPQLLVVKYVNDRTIFYQLGGIQVYDLVCETFEYSSERLNTGIAGIDDIERNYSLNMNAYGILTSDGYRITDQDGFGIIQQAFAIEAQITDSSENNSELQLEANDILDWTEIDPFSEGLA